MEIKVQSSVTSFRYSNFPYSEQIALADLDEGAVVEPAAAKGTDKDLELDENKEESAGIDFHDIVLLPEEIQSENDTKSGKDADENNYMAYNDDPEDTAIVE